VAARQGSHGDEFRGDLRSASAQPADRGRGGHHDRHLHRGAADFDLELIECRTLDRDIQELTYRPTLHA
jgi:hypothetical protein